MSKIIYTDKQLPADPNNPATNEQWSYSDANSVKASVNQVYDDVTALTSAVGAKADTTYVNGQLSSEAIVRQNADTQLSNDIANGDSNLQSQINALPSTSIVDGKVAAEASVRNAADITLQNNIDNEASARATADSNIQSQVSALSAALILHPTYTAPSSSLSSSQSSTGLEVGQTVNIPLTVSFAQNDGGSQGAISLKKDGTQIATAATYTDSGVVMSTTAKVYQANVSYGQGPIKNNVLGIPDSVGRIGASNQNTNSLSYQGFYRVWYDTVSAFPTDSATVRALANTRFSNSGNTFTLNTGSVNTKFCIVLPPGKTLVSVIDQDALSLDITSQYVQSSITVNDAAGTAVTTYKIYSMSQSIPYSSSHRHNITIA